MMITVSAAEAQERFFELLDHTENGDHITITQHGRPTARLTQITAASMDLHWSSFWADVDTRRVVLGPEFSIKTDIEADRA
jgi:prevent-host-death family protein